MKKTFHRRNLPHLYYDEGVYFVTYRLINSLPNKLLKETKEFQINPTQTATNKFRIILRKYDSALNSEKYGENYLIDKRIAIKNIKAIHYPDGIDYRLICYCIMPNHIHIVFELMSGNKGVSKIMQSIKRISARDSNIILNRTGSFWQSESFDRLVRDDKELYFIIRYVLMNPQEAGLVNDWKDWKYTYCHPDFQIID